MAVVDEQLYESTSRKSASQGGGTFKKVVRQLVSVAALDSNGSIYRVAKLPASAVITDIRYINDNMAGSTDWDTGLYGPDGGAVKDADVFDDGIDFSSDSGPATPTQGMTAVGISDRQKQLYELAGDDDVTYPGHYDVALTANTVGTEAGSILVEIEYVLGV